MSMFLVYDAENYEYILQPAGYVVLVVILIALLLAAAALGKNKKAEGAVPAKKLTF